MSSLIKLSPTTGLNLFSECRRCFWLHYNRRVHRPRGIFPSLPSGMDEVIKDYIDSYREKDILPPELQGNVTGSLMPDLYTLNRWRNWQTNALSHEYKRLNVIVFGALDDCLIDDNYYIPMDYKTRGWAPKSGQSQEYYQTQLDTYSLLLHELGYNIRNFAYLLYYFPQKAYKNGRIDFKTQVVKVETNIERAKRKVKDAVETLRGPLPKSHSGCEYCSWIGDRLGFE